jgi:hypothetical protein
MNGLMLRTPVDVLAAVPYLLGFHPTDSLVALALRGKQIIYEARTDTPPPGSAAGVATHLASVLARHGPTGVMLVGYGPPEPTDTALTRLDAAFEAVRVPVLDAIRAERGRYWRPGCDDPGCCPAEGTSYDPSVTEIAAAATFAGVAAAPTREALEAMLAPIAGAGLEPELDRAELRFIRVCAGGSRRRRAAARAAVTDALAARRVRGRLDPADVAWLATLLTDVTIRDDTWKRIVSDDNDPVHADLWREVLRRVPDRYVPAPATLYGLCCWRRGDGIAAGIAVQRALDIDPAYRLADLLSRALLAGLSPSALEELPAPDVARRGPRFRGA